VDLGVEVGWSGVTTHPLWRPFVPAANAARQGQRVASRQVDPGPLRDHDPGWAADFARVERIIREAISERALAIDHVGSTAVPGLLAKPIIDIDLTVADVENEPSYLPQLERAGFRLIFRDEMGGDPHRHLTFADPNTNLHIWRPGAVEPRRHLLFTTWLRSSPEDRRRYNEAKAAAVADPDRGRYNDLKAAVVHEIYDRAFAADLDRSRPGDAPRSR
jgi:GrpB-like predicted nucleotidyltransferase (UPF0157 family)